MLAKLKAAWLKLYHNKTFYRLFWTSIQAGSGILAGIQWHRADVAFIVTGVVTVLTSWAREALGGGGGDN